MRRFARGLVLAILAGTLSLLVAEGVLRLLGLAPTTGLTTVSASEFDRIPGILSPQLRFIDLRNRELPHRVTVDSLGYRGAPFSRVKPKGEVRVLMAGDSFIYGDFVDDSLTLPAQLEARLVRSCPGARVINAGLPGATITEHKEIIARGLAIAPDLVILAFTENDVGDLASRPLWELLADHRASKARFPFSAVYPLLRRTALWNLALQVRGRLRTEGHPDAPQRRAAPGRNGGIAPDPALRARYADALTEIAALLSARGVAFAFMDFPAHLTLYGEWSTEQLDWVERTARAAGVTVYSAMPALLADGRGETELFLLPLDGHPSGAGYAVAADFLAKSLLAAPPLRSRCSAASE